MYKVVITSDAGDKSFIPLAKKMFDGIAEVTYNPCPSQNEDELIEKCKDADAVISMMEPFTDKVFAALPNLKLVSVLSIGFNWVDTAAAEKYGVAVTNNPTFCTSEVADHTVALALTACRRILQYNKGVKEDLVWDYFAQTGHVKRLSDQVYGLVGLGAIAKQVAVRMRGFGCELIAYDPFVTQEQADEFGVTMVSLEELCSRANIISLHCPLMPETEGMINSAMFSLMEKNQPILINTGRGGLLVEEDFLVALQKGQIGFACIDDFIKQNPDPHDIPFVKEENCIITPHAGFYSTSSVIDQSTMAVQHVIDFINGDTAGLPFRNSIRAPKA